MLVFLRCYTPGNLGYSMVRYLTLEGKHEYAT